MSSSYNTQDAQVKPDRPIADVIQVILYAQRVVSTVAAAVHLPPAGHTLGHGEALAVLWLVPFDHPGEFGPWSYQAHVALEHVEELW